MTPVQKKDPCAKKKDPCAKIKTPAQIKTPAKIITPVHKIDLSLKLYIFDIKVKYNKF